MKILSVRFNNRKKSFEVTTRSKSFLFPYVKADPAPTADDSVVRVRVDEELSREGFVYTLESRREATVHFEQILEYNQDPTYLRDLLLYKLTLEAQRRVNATALSKREIIRRLGTSATQFYRLLDQTNYRKSVDQVLTLLHVLDCDVDVIVSDTAFERIFAGSGRVHDHRQKLYIIPFADRCEYLSGLIDDPRIAGPVASILGSDYNYATSNGNYYVGDTMWHSDHHLDVPFHSVKIGFYLDPVGVDSGCLRLIPGSFNHGDSFSDALHAVVPISAENRSREVCGVHGSEVPAVAIESTPGDMVLFNHTAWGGGSKRRMLTYNFEERMTGTQIPHLAQTLSDEYARNGTIFGEAMLRTAGPERRRHLEQRLRIAAEHGIIPDDGRTA